MREDARSTRVETQKASGKWSAWRPMLTWQQHRASADQPRDTPPCATRGTKLHADPINPRRESGHGIGATIPNASTPGRESRRSETRPAQASPGATNLEADSAGLKGGTAAPERDSTQRRKSAEPKTLISSPGTNSGCVPQVPPTRTIRKEKTNTTQSQNPLPPRPGCHFRARGNLNLLKLPKRRNTNQDSPPP